MKATAQKIFVMRSSNKEGDYIFRAILDAAEGLQTEVFRPEQTWAGSSVFEVIQKAMSEAALVVADVTDANLNVLFELGWAHGNSKPIILIGTSLTKIPPDIGGYLTVLADPDVPRSELVRRIGETMGRALMNPTAFTYAGLEQRLAQKGAVFISYSHKDTACLERLLVHLKPLQRSGRIQLWVDTNLRAGDRWKEEIKKALGRSSIAVLLVSADFLASEFIVQNELPPLLMAAEQEGTRIISIIVKPCRFVRDPHLSHFQAANPPERSMISLSESDQEALYDSVAALIEAVTQNG